MSAVKRHSVARKSAVKRHTSKRRAFSCLNVDKLILRSLCGGHNSTRLHVLLGQLLLPNVNLHCAVQILLHTRALNYHSTRIYAILSKLVARDQCAATPRNPQIATISILRVLSKGKSHDPSAVQINLLLSLFFFILFLRGSKFVYKSNKGCPERSSLSVWVSIQQLPAIAPPRIFEVSRFGVLWG